MHGTPCPYASHTLSARACCLQLSLAILIHIRLPQPYCVRSWVLPLHLPARAYSYRSQHGLDITAKHDMHADLAARHAPPAVGASTYASAASLLVARDATLITNEVYQCTKRYVGTVLDHVLLFFGGRWRHECQATRPCAWCVGQSPHAQGSWHQEANSESGCSSPMDGRKAAQSIKRQSGTMGSALLPPLSSSLLTVPSPPSVAPQALFRTWAARWVPLWFPITHWVFTYTRHTGYVIRSVRSNLPTLV